MSAIWEVIVDPVVRKQLKRFPQKDVDRILGSIEGMTYNPYAGDIEKMKREADVWRRRVGSYRIFYEVTPAKRLVHVYRVVRRTSTTY